MKKAIVALVAACLLVPFSYAQNTKHSNKEEKERKERLEKKEKGKEGEEGEEDEKEDIETATEHAKEKWFKLMQQPQADYFKVQKKFTRYFKKHPLEGSGPKEYGLSWLKTNLFYLDKKGKVQAPPVINLNKIAKGQSTPPPNATDTMAGDWRMVGPRNSVQVGAGVGNNGGYGYCVRMDPTNTNKMFISFVTGGLWVSADNGNAWHLADANMPANDYYDIDVCKANSNIVYAIQNAAVVKSTDGGMSWNTTNLNTTNYPGQAYDIAASPTDPNVVVARWGANIYRTADGGTTWTVIKTGLKTFSIWDSNLNSEVLDWDNSNNNIVYFTDRGDTQNYVDVYKSTDGGLTFSLLQTLPLAATATGTVTGWSKICTATNNPNAVYVMVGSGTSSYVHIAVQMYKLDIATGNISLQRTNMIDGVNTAYGSPTSLHHGDIAMDITDENKIVWGCYSQQNAQYSSNNGASFSTSTTVVHSDLRSVYMVNGKVILGTDGSTVVSTDGGNNFTIVSNTISNHELWGFGSSFNSDILAAGCNHGPLMLREYEAPGGWYSVLGADQGNSDFNPLDSVSAYSQGYDSYHVTRTGIKTFTNGAQQIDPGGIYSYFNSMEFHPNLFHTLITHHAGGYPASVPQATRDIWKNSLIRSDDNGITLKVLHTFSTQLFREKICMSDTNRIYAVVGLTANTLQKTTDGGATWTDITPPTSVTGASVRNMSDVAVSDVNPNEIWVTYSGVQNTCQVLHSTDGGVTYTNLTSVILTSNPITKIIFQRGTNGGVYVGNTSGIYYRNNTMADWVELGNGLPAMDMRFMFINYAKGKLLIGTSRGAWDHDLYEHSATSAQISASTNIPNCQATSVQFRDYSVVSNGGSGVTYAWSFPGGVPSTSNLQNPIVNYAGSATGSRFSVTLTVTDQYGTSTQTLTNFIYYDGSNCCQGAPAGWTQTDIGTPTAPSELCYINGNYKITSHSAGFSDPTDNPPFIYQTLTGDGQIVARVKDVSTTYNFNGGIMVRNTLAANSAYAYLNSLDTRGVFDQYRTADGGTSGYRAVTTLAMPMWLKLQRQGNVVKSFYSSDNITWIAYHTYNFTALNTTVYVGLTASGNGAVTDIDSVSVGPIPILPCTGGSVNGCPAYDTIPGKAINFYDYSYFNVPVTIPSTNTFTFTGWIKPKGVLGSQSSIFAWDNGYFYMGQGDDNQLGYVWNSGDASNTWNSGLFVPADKWSFVAMVVHPDSTTLYLNNKISTNVTPQGMSAVANGILGNSNPGAGYFLGQMDELTVWKRALSTNEIDSMRHLTKEKLAMPTSASRDLALVSYFQFNDSLSTSSFNQIDSSKFDFGGGANKITSTIPVGAGNSAMQSVSGAGSFAFGNTGVVLTFPASATYPNGNIWVTKINQLPDAIPKVTAASPAYWVINNYGDSAFSPLASMQINNALNITTVEATTPNIFSFFKRDLVAEGATWGVPINNATAATAGTFGDLTFTPANITSQGQIIAAKGFILPPTVDTIPGKAMKLTGYPDKLTVPELSIPATNTFTITGWIKPSVIEPANAGIIMNKPTANAGGLIIRNATNELGYIWNNDASYNFSTGLTLPVNQWSFVALVITPTTGTVYLNNKKAIRTGVTNAAISPVGFCFGEDFRNYTNRSFAGQMDEITIWNRALSDDEIRGMRHLTKEKQVDYTKSNYDASLVGLWQFNETAGTAASNIISGVSNPFVGKAADTVSTAPIGKGVSTKASVTAAGIYSFANTGIKMGFHAGTVPNGDLWVTKLNQNPNGVPTGNADVSQYWVVNNYGTNSTFTTLDSMVFNGVLNISPTNAALPSSFQLYKRTDNAEGATWGTAQASGTYAVAGSPGNISFGTGNNITSFSQFYLTNPAAVLPVTLISFTAAKQAQDVLLKWVVTNEFNFNHYEIEHSLDGNDFTSIGTVKGTGLSNYSFVDNKPANGENYYRLKLVDDDGHFHYSNIVEISVEKTGFIKFSPNPLHSGEYLLAQNTSSSEAEVNFYLPDGKLFGKYIIPANGKIQINNLPKGSILYQAVNKNGKKTSGVQVVL